MPVVPLKAARVSLPDSLRLVPLASVLPEDVARLYSTPDCPALLRDPLPPPFARPSKLFDFVFGFIDF
jgi:hypothetical protein